MYTWIKLRCLESSHMNVFFTLGILFQLPEFNKETIYEASLGRLSVGISFAFLLFPCSEWILQILELSGRNFFPIFANHFLQPFANHFLSRLLLQSVFLADSCYKVAGKKMKVENPDRTCYCTQVQRTNAPCFIHLTANYAAIQSHTAIQGQLFKSHKH